MKNEPQRTSAGRLELRFIKKTGDLCDGVRVSEAIQYIWEDCQKKKQLRSDVKEAAHLKTEKDLDFIVASYHTLTVSYIKLEMFEQ